MNQSQQQKISNLVFIEWDGVHGWEKYVVTYDQALSLIPILAPKVPSITITDYEFNKVQRKSFETEFRSASEQSSSNESTL